MNTKFKNYFNNNFSLVAILLVILFSFQLFHFFQIHSLPFYDWDESIYAYLIKNNSFTIFPLYNQSLWLEKSPFLFLIFKIVADIFPSIESSLRFTNLLFSWSVIILSLFILAKTFYKKDRFFVRISSQLMLITGILTSNIFLDRSFNLNTDMWLVISFLGFIYFQKNFIARFFFTILGVGSKSLLGFFPLAIYSLIESWRFIRDKNWNKLIKLYVGSLLIVAISSWWHILGLIIYKQRFWQEHFLDHLFARVASPIELHFGGKMYYVKLIASSYPILFWILVATILIFSFRKQILLNLAKSTILNVILLLIAYFSLITYSKTKISWYALPLPILFSVTTAYLTLQIKNVKVHYILSILNLFLIISIFIPKMLIKVPTEKNELVHIASCINKFAKKEDKINCLVEPNEREIAHTLEAANLDIGSSFRYAGHPTFLYYLISKVKVIYKLSDVSVNSEISFYFFNQLDDKFIFDKFNKYVIKCESKNWKLIQIN